MDLLPAANVTSSALNAEQLRMQIIAQNIANANTTRTADGTPYRRQLIAFESVMDRAASSTETNQNRLLQSVSVEGIYDDPSAFKQIFNPDHPHADEQGMVALPNVDQAMEMVDLITASRAYEANLAVIRTSRQMAKQALSINY
jgi:flagellar basal-body rod protein FlgC